MFIVPGRGFAVVVTLVTVLTVVLLTGCGTTGSAVHAAPGAQCQQGQALVCRVVAADREQSSCGCSSMRSLEPRLEFFNVR